MASCFICAINKLEHITFSMNPKTKSCEVVKEKGKSMLAYLGVGEMATKEILADEIKYVKSAIFCTKY